MAKIYYFSNQLIIMDKVYKMDKYETTQQAMLKVLRASIKVIYDAHEIWFYNSATSQFEMYKNKSGLKTRLETFFEDKGINLKCDAADMTAKAISYRFKDPVDEFHFNLKF